MKLTGAKDFQHRRAPDEPRLETMPVRLHPGIFRCGRCDAARAWRNIAPGCLRRIRPLGGPVRWGAGIAALPGSDIQIFRWRAKARRSSTAWCTGKYFRNDTTRLRYRTLRSGTFAVKSRRGSEMSWLLAGFGCSFFRRCRLHGARGFAGGFFLVHKVTPRRCALPLSKGPACSFPRFR